MGQRGLTGHTRFKRGKRLRVKMRSGEVFEDRYVGDASSHAVLERRGRVAKRDILKMTILKGRLDGQEEGAGRLRRHD
jgi:hypothetical protein